MATNRGKFSERTTGLLKWMGASAGGGILLILIALYCGVNLVEVSLVNNAIAGTPIHMFLLVACVPGLVAALMGIGSAVSCYGLAIVVQALVYAAAGALVFLVLREKTPDGGSKAQGPQ